MNLNTSMNKSFKKEIRKKNEFPSANGEQHLASGTEEITCRFCGAPVRTEICPYCGKPTGLDTASAPMDYPELGCKEAHLDFWGTWFPLIFALSFGFFGFIFPLIFSAFGEADLMVRLICLPFALISIGAFAILIKNIAMYLSVILFGKEIEGKVYGYADDTVLYNDIPGQVCKLLVTTATGKRFIMYQLKSTNKPYPINTTVTLKVYKDRFLVFDKQKYAIWE